MADKKISWSFAARDTGVARTLDKIGDAAADTAEETSKLAAGQLELREAALKAQRAEDQLATARGKLSKVTQLAAASDQDKRRATQQVEAAEIKHERALLAVADAAEKSRRAIDRTGDAVHDAGEKASRSTTGFKGLGKNIGSALEGGLKSGVATLPAIALGAGLLVGGALVKGIKKTLDAQDATAKLKVQMGLTPAESAKIGKVAGELYSKAYGTGMDQVRDAIKSVVQNGAVLNGTMSKDLNDVSGKVLNLANTFDQDLGGVTRAVGQMLRTGMAKDGAQALDILTRGFQSGADKAEDLLDTFNEYPTQFRKLGLDGTAAMGLISQALKAGARDSDVAADALKEFSIRAVDGSKTTIDGFKSLGLNASEMAQKIAAGGKTATGGLDQVLDGLRRIKDPVERSRIAVELFGTQAEDLGDALYAMDPTTAARALGVVGGAADQMGKDLTTPQARLTALKRTLETKVTGWLLTAFDWFYERRFDIALGLLDVADGAITLIKPLAGVASVGLRVGQALVYVAAAALMAKGKISQGKEVLEFGNKMGDAASKAWDLGDTLTTKASPAVAALRARMEALRSREVTIRAIDAATKAAQRIRTELAKVPGNKNVSVTVSQNGTVQMVQRQIDSITGHVVEIVVGQRGRGVTGYAEGGLVTGPGGPRDDKVPAMLSNREYVMPAEQTDRYLPILEAMRQDRVAMMAGGGMVGGRPATAVRPGGGGQVLQPIVIQLDGRTLWQGLVKLRRDIGPLGLS